MSRTPITRANPYTPKGGAFAGLTFHSERQYRNALARHKGFTSEYQRQQIVRTQRNAAAVARLSPRQQEARDRTLRTISHLRGNDALRLRRPPRRRIRHRRR